MPNPYPANFEVAENLHVRLDGDITFTDPANQPGGGGGGQVNSVTAGDASITIGGTVTDPTVAVAALGVTSAKIASGAVTQAKIAAKSVDEAQMASAGPVTANWVPLADGSGGVAWGVSPGVNSVTAGDTSIVVGGTAAAPTIETATLDVIASDHPPAANWSNNSHKITSLANGTAAQDAAAFGQIPTALPPNGTAGGDLSGTYPNPTVAAIEGVAVSGTAPTANQVLTASDATHAAWATPSSGGSTDGWTSSSDTWTYSSFTAGPPAVGVFTISGVDRTAQLQPGTYIKLTQTTTKYFVVQSSSFSTNTTVNVTGGTDYTLANASITNPYYSYVQNPQGWPGYFGFAAGTTGSTSTTEVARFCVNGRNVVIALDISGTSNASSKSITLPITPANISGIQWICMLVIKNNGTVQTTPGEIVINPNNASASLYINNNAQPWNSSGTWFAIGTGSYEM